MRLLLYALLVINLAFFAWARWVDVPPPAVAAASDSTPPLQLAGAGAAPAAAAASSAALPSADVPAAPPVAATPAAAIPEAANTAVAPSVPAVAGAQPPAASVPAMPPGAHCRSVGPFDDGGMANVVADRLRTRGFSPRTRSASGSNPNVYWVYIGELTAEAQRQAIRTLSNAGIRDAVSMTQPEESDRVSVGVFSDQAHAVKRAEQVRALGFKPTLGMRQRNLTLHWVDFDVGESASEPSAAQLVGVAPRPAPGVGPARIVDCPAGDSG